MKHLDIVLGIMVTVITFLLLPDFASVDDMPFKILAFASHSMISAGLGIVTANIVDNIL